MKDLKLDPRTKIILLIIVGITIYSYVPSFIIGIYVFAGFILLLLCKEHKNIFLYLLLFFIFKLILSYDFVSQIFILKPLFIILSIFVSFFPLLYLFTI